jgi:hypothetical protein
MNRLCPAAGTFKSGAAECRPWELGSTEHDVLQRRQRLDELTNTRKAVG